LKRILILLHECQRPIHGHYLISALREAWQERGLQVSLVYGVKDRPEADLLIPHIDLTHTPPEYVEYTRSFVSVVNRNVVDISKRTISTHLLRGDEDYGGPVIVKTDNNYGGRPEYLLSKRRHPLLARAWRRVAPIAEYALGQRLAWRSLLREYPLYSSLAEVPSAVFKNRALVVERFLPEREGDRYFIRHYLCLGDRTRSVRVAGSTPVLKRAACTLVDEGLAVPDPVLSLRRRLGLDYGKIDYTIHAGQVVILDVNRTPSVPGTPEATARVVANLADGIWSLLPYT
jgi:hypothetical protein